MIVYIYSKCSTCKNAIRFLQDASLQVTVREITVTPPSLQELEAMLKFQNGNVRKLFNTSGNMYKEMHLAEKIDAMPLNEALELLSTHGMLVKRPFLLTKDFGLLGFKQAEWAKVLNVYS